MPSIGRIPLPSALLAFGLIAPACFFSDLDLNGKRCDPESPCPENLVCVEAPDSPTTRIGLCYALEDAPTCTPGNSACAGSGGWVEECSPDGHSRTVSSICDAGRVCNPDVLECSHNCALDADCEPAEACDVDSGLCRPYPICLAGACEGQCVGAACVPTAPADASTPVGQPELECFLTQPSNPPGQPAACELTGRVNLFPSKDNSEQAIGLTLLLRDAVFPYAEIQATTVTMGGDSKGYYTFADVATNRSYVAEVVVGTSDDGHEVVTTLNAGIDLRADACLAGSATRGLSALRKTNFDTFTAETIEGLGGHRALLIGRALDCNTDARRPLGNVTVGLAISPPEPGRIYYFADESFLFPDLSLEATSNKGYYAAVGLPATRNEIGFAARQNTTDVVLGRVAFFAEPDTAVIVDLPLPSEMLPP